MMLSTEGIIILFLFIEDNIIMLISTEDNNIDLKCYPLKISLDYVDI